MVRKISVSQAPINTRVRSSEDHRVPISIQLKDQLRLPVEDYSTGPSAPGGSSRGHVPPYCTHYGRKHKGDCWRLTGAYLVCGSNEHKVRDCPRARSFTSLQTGGTVSTVPKSNKDNKSVASPSAPRQATQTMGK